VACHETSFPSRLRFPWVPFRAGFHLSFISHSVVYPVGSDPRWSIPFENRSGGTLRGTQGNPWGREINFLLFVSQSLSLSPRAPQNPLPLEKMTACWKKRELGDGERGDFFERAGAPTERRRASTETNTREGDKLETTRTRISPGRLVSLRPPRQLPGPGLSLPRSFRHRLHLHQPWKAQGGRGERLHRLQQLPGPARAADRRPARPTDGAGPADLRLKDNRLAFIHFYVYPFLLLSILGPGPGPPSRIFHPQQRLLPRLGRADALARR